MDITELAGTMRIYQQLFDRFVRHNPIDVANAEIKSVRDAFNAWQEQSSSEIDAKKATLGVVEKELNEMGDRIAGMDDELKNDKDKLENNEAITAYNQRVQERNLLVEEQRNRYPIYQETQRQYNEQVEAFNEEQKSRLSAIEELKNRHGGTVQEYEVWHKQNGVLNLFTDVTRFYATLLNERRENSSSGRDLDHLADQARLLRRELGQLEEEREHRHEQGFLIVSAVLSDKEESRLFVDTGSTFSAITDEMVDVLGIRKMLGDEVELILPNNLKTSARQILIPRLAIGPHSAEYVKAVVLKESMPGIDGCIGLSFLNRFIYRIERTGGGTTLVLEAAKAIPKHPCFDVFISHTSEDAIPAREVYDVLKAIGYSPFLSEVSIAHSQINDFQIAIDDALSNARHLVVICSSCDFVSKAWVQYEWQTFKRLKLSGQKWGNIVPVLCGDAKPEALPVGLSGYQAVMMDQVGWKELLAGFLPQKPLGIT